jgi:sugar phosphate isomerase/epimerase
LESIVADRVLLGANLHTFDDCLTLATQYGLGMEIQTFAYPDVLSGDWRAILRDYKRKLVALPGERAMHGPFIDMAAGSPDPLIREVVRARITTAIDTASELHAATLVFHANFIASMRNDGYRNDFLRNQIDFWPALAERAAASGVTIVLENMWEFTPHIICDVLEAINLPSLRACLDVGHARLFSDAQHAISEWIRVLAPWLTHVHMNNNPGTIDEHHALDDGVIDYTKVMPLLRALPHQPTFSLEMADVGAMQRSFRFLKLPEVVKRV